jgi:hypothetical protein
MLTGGEQDDESHETKGDHEIPAYLKLFNNCNCHLED